jgi:hypothetical protein
MVKAITFPKAAGSGSGSPVTTVIIIIFIILLVAALLYQFNDNIKKSVNDLLGISETNPSNNNNKIQ